MSKGSKTRREDFKKVQNNWTEINWKPKTCFVCGMKVSHSNVIKNPELYHIDGDGSVKHKHCI